MELRILNAPCQRCGRYHDEPPPPAPKPLSAMEGLELAAEGIREMIRRTPVADPPDLADAIRNGHVRAHEAAAPRVLSTTNGVPDPPDLGARIRAARGGAR